ncbi:class I SAM-dependent DNA methyltransferase, partial [Campylobacter jejuni]
AKIERIGTPLKEWHGLNIYRGILTGYNEAFIITTEKRNEILANCKDEAEKERTAKLIRKMLRGRDIKRYSYEWAGLWVIGTFPSLKLDIEQYPALKQYLSQFLPRIEQSGEKGCRKKTSNKWFETQDNIAYYEEFEKEKIVYPNMN